MKISENVKKVLIVSAVVVGVCLLIRFAGAFVVRALIYLFGLLSPFAIGYVIAKLINPIAARLQKWLKIPRGISAVLVIIFTVGVIGGILGLLVYQLFDEIRSLYMDWDNIIASLRDNWRSLSASWDKMYIGIPDFIRNVINNAFDGLYKQSVEMTSNIPGLSLLIPLTKLTAISVPTCLNFWTASSRLYAAMV